MRCYVTRRNERQRFYLTQERVNQRLICTTLAGGKPLNQVDEAWL